MSKKNFWKNFLGGGISFWKKIIVELYDVINDGQMELFLKTLTGGTITLRVDYNEHIGFLKIRIQEKGGIPTDQFQLIYVGKQLDKTRTLVDYTVILVVIRPPSI